MNKNSNQVPSRLPEGIWGGDHIILEVTRNGASIEYDCAHGTIEQEIVLDNQGKFSVKGFHVRESPGPIRVGREEKGQPANFTGTSDGKNLTFTVSLEGSDESIGTFQLTHGASGRIRKCK